MDAFFDYIRTIPFPFVVMGFLVVFVIVCALIHECYKTRLNNELKCKMLDRGMSAQEIEQVMNAGKDNTKEIDVQTT